jgi:hypothetical protein
LIREKGEKLVNEIVKALSKWVFGIIKGNDIEPVHIHPAQFEISGKTKIFKITMENLSFIQTPEVVYPGIKVNPFSPEGLQSPTRLLVFFEDANTHPFPAENIAAKKAAKAAADDYCVVLVFSHPAFYNWKY